MKKAFVVFAFSWVILLIRLDHPSKLYFDENFYVGAVRSFAHSHVIGNTEHPPLSKYFIGMGMALLGDNAYGWRVSSTVFGAMLAAIMWAWVLELFGCKLTATTATILLAVSSFWFNMSRVAMPSIFELTFAVAGLYLYTLHRSRGLWIGYAGIMLGLAMACKWNAIVYIIVVLVLLYKDRDKQLTLGLLSIASYLICFVPVILRQHSGIDSLYEMQVFILQFHRHTFGSVVLNQTWYKWILRMHPEYGLFYLIANPMITIIGLVCLPIVLFCRQGRLLAILYLANLTFWAVAHRPFEYYYYYLDAFVFLCPVIAFACLQIRSKLNVRLDAATMLTCSAGFAMYYGSIVELSTKLSCVLGCH